MVGEKAFQIRSNGSDKGWVASMIIFAVIGLPMNVHGFPILWGRNYLFIYDIFKFPGNSWHLRSYWLGCHFRLFANEKNFFESFDISSTACRSPRSLWSLSDRIISKSIPHRRMFKANDLGAGGAPSASWIRPDLKGKWHHGALAWAEVDRSMDCWWSTAVSLIFEEGIIYLRLIFAEILGTYDGNASYWFWAIFEPRSLLYHRIPYRAVGGGDDGSDNRHQTIQSTVIRHSQWLD